MAEPVDDLIRKPSNSFTFVMARTTLIALLFATYSLFCVSPGSGQSSHANKALRITDVLPLIERFKAPPQPKSLYIDRETYDYRIAFHRPVPATLTDVLACDVWQRITIDLKLTVTPEEVTEAVVGQAIDVYLKKGWSDIAGYRPWTHWNFIRKLRPPQRAALAKELAAYINKNGVRDVEEPEKK